jgi:hypothetical protein
MATRLIHVVVDAGDPVGLAGFWAEALGWVRGDVDEDGECSVQHPAGSPVDLLFCPVDDPKRTKNRLHLDLAGGLDTREVLTRLRGLGATPADIGQGDVAWTVLADPEGNEFCVLPEEPSTGPIAALCLDAADPARQAAFWGAATGFVVVREGSWGVALASPGGEGPRLVMGPPVAAKAGKNRLHFDVAPHLGDDHGLELARLESLGAVRVDVGQRDVDWFVLADPEGNELCLLAPR